MGRTTDEDSPQRTVIGRSFGGFSWGGGFGKGDGSASGTRNSPSRSCDHEEGRSSRRVHAFSTSPCDEPQTISPDRVPPPSLDTSRSIGFRHSRIVGGRPWGDGKHCNLCRGLEIVQRFRVYDGDGGIRSNTRQGHGCDGDARRGVAYCTRARCRTLETTSRCLSLLLFSYISYHALTLHTLRSTPPSNDGTRCVKTSTRRSVSRRPPAVKFSFSALSSRH